MLCVDHFAEGRADIEIGAVAAGVADRDVLVEGAEGAGREGSGDLAAGQQGGAQGRAVIQEGHGDVVLGASLDSVAVKVTEAPSTVGFSEDDTTMVAMRVYTVRVRFGEAVVLPVKLASPP